MKMATLAQIGAGLYAGRSRGGVRHSLKGKWRE